MKKGTNSPNSYCGFVDQSVRNFMINWTHVMTGIDAISPILIHSARRRAKLVVPGAAEVWSNAAEGDLGVAIVPLGQSRDARASRAPNSPLPNMHALACGKCSRSRQAAALGSQSQLQPNQHSDHMYGVRLQRTGGNYNVMKNAAISLAGGGNRTL